MKTFQIHRAATVPQPLREVFSFFAEAGNLEAITPPWLHFRILTPRPLVMRSGLKIDYQLRLHGLRLHWQSEISVWDPPYGFVDEQIKGPYRRWVHHHRFSEGPDGTTVEDHVEYAVWGSGLVDRLIVAPRLKQIFDYRQQKLARLLNESTDDGLTS
ncbi:MAG: SRPBCC family protein [Deltaproteobacteria bacterium]|nr:SRPBCC family protein [Deltaproteobacteria bacterium]